MNLGLHGPSKSPQSNGELRQLFFVVGHKPLCLMLLIFHDENLNALCTALSAGSIFKLQREWLRACEILDSGSRGIVGP
jgi:hypothetical protein